MYNQLKTLKKMKKYILLALSVCALTACDLADGEGGGSDNAVYMGNANSSGVISMVVSYMIML